jgi:pyruvate kinase
MTPEPWQRRGRRAKIVATVGPSSASPDMLARLFAAGVDTFRLNFSHGSHDDHAKVHRALRALEAEKGTPIGILQDLQGPKFRIGVLDGGPRDLMPGDAVRFVLEARPNDRSGAIPLPHPEVFDALMPGHAILINDGRIRVAVTGAGSGTIEGRVEVGGRLSDRKGVNLPGSLIDLSPLTAKDREDLAFGLSLGVDWVALSFVQRPSDLIEAHALIGGRAGLVAKIEKPQALERISDIVQLADAVMVARGDLGVELAPEEVPGRQKELVRLCRLAAKPVIVATQMLESMIQSPTPTRAEASDVATAIYDGADAVMLSAESAAGAYPVEAVAMMDRIIRHTETHEFYRPAIRAIDLDQDLDATLSHVVAGAAADMADRLGAAAILAFTARGITATRIARQRPNVSIVALTPSLEASRRLCLLWGTHSARSHELTGYEEMVEAARSEALAHGFVVPGDLVVAVSGIPFGQAGSTNNIRVVRIDAAGQVSRPIEASQEKRS